MSSDVSDHTCRICRGEATTSQPLYHPCKCRGSIKYVHQSCLMEWLKHANKSTEKCDICNTSYKFKIIYDPAMPQYIPISLIWVKFIQIMSSTLIKSIAITLYVLCLLIQLPLFWKFIGRVYTWAVDGNLPLANQSFWNALFFGEFNIDKYLSTYSSESTTPLQLALLKLRKFIGYTYFSGVRYLVVAIIVHCALFLVREWVVRDESYIKLLNRKIGKEPRTKLVDMLQNALQGLRNDGDNGNAAAAANLQRLETLAQAINDLQHDNDAPTIGEEDIRRDLNRRRLFANDNNNNNHNIHGLHNIQQQQPENEDVFNDERRTVFLGPEGNEHPPAQNHGNPPIPNYEEPIAPERNIIDDIFGGDNDDDDSDEEEDDEDDAEAAAIAAAAAAAAENGNNNNQGENGVVADFLENFGVTLSIKTPIQLMFLFDFLIAVYLFVAYLIPHMLGNLCVTIVGLGLKLVNKTVVPKLYNWLYLDDAVKYFDAHFPTGHDFIDYSLGTVNTYLVQPLISTFNNLFISPNAQFTLIERIILLAIGYSLICGVIYRLMNFLASGKKPISGTPRKVFKVLFEITATIKVFVIFSIELFVFPVYCGWLLDFCAASLFIPSFKENQSKIFVFLVTSYYTTLQIPYLRVLLYWSSGTLYMLFFALFIGMLRSTVIRPGVLFFIRSPDDPNARLIHDALRKPMSLQLSRIQFTGKFYSAFILVGIGGVTWGLRGFVQPSNNVDYNVFLPIQVPYYFTFILLTVIVPSIVESQPVITKYVRQYWARIFEISAHKVRLSHFVLGKPISHERGHVVYRSLWYQFFGNSLPDYTRPVSYRGAMDIFKENPSVTCCFVPDGNYVRVPDNDTVSRKYSRKLFVPVTKDDKLLVDIDESSLTSNTGYDTPTSEEDEINTDNAYTIVYRPPNFKWRCFGLICMLWVFAVILILLVALVAVLLGRPVLRANSIAFEYIPLVSINELTNMDWKLVDSASIAIGLAIELQILIYYDKHYSTEGPTGAGGNEVDRVANNDANLGEGVPGEVEPNQAGFWQRNIFGQIINRLPTPVLYTIPSSTLWIVWIVTVHNLCVDRPIRFVTNNLDVEFLLNFKTLFVHFIASFWTLLPALIYVTRRIPLEGHTVWQTMDRCGMIPVLINFCMIPLPAFIILFIMKTMNVSDNSMQVYLWPLLFVLLALVKSIKGGIEMYTNINDQVKQEKYVKGRAIENVDIDEEENDS